VFGGGTMGIAGFMRPWIHPSDCLCCIKKTDFAQPVRLEGSPMNFRQERLAVQRTWRHQGALVVMPGLRSVYSCRVRDLSIKGAGLQLPTEIALVPTNFKLSFDGFRHSFECRLIWRHLNFVGLEFKLW
jgi:hypothetical protein